MPVDESYQETWPVFRRAWKTSADSPITTVLARADSAGYVGLVPELVVMGRTQDGAVGIVLSGAYTLLGRAGSAVSQPSRPEDVQEYGVTGSLAVAVGPVARELHLTCTGLRGVEVSWVAFWRVVESPPL